MPSYRDLFYLSLAVIGWAFLGLAADPALATQSLFVDYKGIVAIDPGHGGTNMGAKGSEGATEKEICLLLARRLVDLMEPDYRIALTRSGDYDINLFERTAVANNQNADVLISLHAAGGFQRAASGITIYYYQPASKGEAAALPPEYGENNSIPWRQLQMRHIPASQHLAALLQQAIETVAGVQDVRVFQAPLVVLQGADMPAVLISVGYLTNPTDEKRLITPERQSVLAQAIVKGVESFLSSK